MSGPITMTLENVLDLLTIIKDKGVQPEYLDYSNPLLMECIDDHVTYNYGPYKVTVIRNGVHLFTFMHVYYLDTVMFTASDIEDDKELTEILRKCIKALDFQCFKIFA